MDPGIAPSAPPLRSGMIFCDQDLKDSQWMPQAILDSSLKDRAHDPTRARSSNGITVSETSSTVSTAESRSRLDQFHSSHSTCQQYQQNFPSPQPQMQHHQKHCYSNSSIHGTPVPSVTSNATRLPHSSTKRRISKEKALKGDREEVWPPDVESAFMKALEILPKLGRRKVLVNGKPCGRNELIADFIYQQTQKVRDRKQVSSHIQVLKNTRKHEPTFMRLLMDAGDGDEDGIQDVVSHGYISTSHSPTLSPHLQHERTDQAFVDEKAHHITDSPPTTIPGQDNNNNPSRYSSHRSHYDHSDLYYHVKVSTTPDAAVDRAMGCSSQSIYQQATMIPGSAVSLLSGTGLRDSVALERMTRDSVQNHPNGDFSSFRQKGPSRTIPASRSSHAPYLLWPTSFGLFIQRSGREVPSDRHDSSSTHNCSDVTGAKESAVLIHDLARAHDLSPHTLGSINIYQLPPEKFPNLFDLYERVSCPFLYFKVGMNLNMELDGAFENTCLFDSNERRALKCSTLIYSFGDNVLESSQMKQATFVNGTFVHSFEFVNQFFNAFLSGIRTLGTLEEVEVALCNLSLVQIYEDLDPQTEGRSPLLVMAFEFEKGRGGVTPYHIM